MSRIIECAVRVRPDFRRVAEAMHDAGVAAAGVTRAFDELAAVERRRMEATRARLAASRVSLDAMHWVPAADGEAVPPCPA